MEPSEPLFTNEQIDISAIPVADRMEMVPLEPSYKIVRYISGSIIAVILILISWILAFAEASWQPYNTYGAVLMTIIAIYIIIYNGISFRYMGYALREKDISFKSGLLWRSMTTVPFIRVQHCDVKQGMLDRRFGLSKLTIYTAGGQSTDLMIPGLSLDTAERLKSFILNSTEQSPEVD